MYSSVLFILAYSVKIKKYAHVFLLVEEEHWHCMRSHVCPPVDAAAAVPATHQLCEVLCHRYHSPVPSPIDTDMASLNSVSWFMH